MIAAVNINFFDKYGRRNGFNILVLRYLLTLNCNRNLCLALDELVAVAACVFCKVDEPWYTGLAILPSVRCITVASWFQVCLESYCNTCDRQSVGNVHTVGIR